MYILLPNIKSHLFFKIYYLFTIIIFIFKKWKQRLRELNLFPQGYTQAQVSLKPLTLNRPEHEENSGRDFNHI